MKKRPAETAGALTGTAGIAAGFATHNWLALGLACAGYVPAVVTFIVGHGGIRGVLGSLWGGKKS